MIELRNVTKTFKVKAGTITAIQNVSLSIADEEIFGIVGFSGAGKSTLVRCMNLLERPNSGDVIVNEQNLMELSKQDLRKARKKIGMIFQDFNLFEQRSVLANVRYPLEIAGVAKNEADERAHHLLNLVGLADRAQSYPSQLSGGQKQRVAIARALANKPSILLCDEATSALDSQATASILDLLKELRSTLGVTIVIITHELSVVEAICDRVAVMDGGKICEQGTTYEVFRAPQSETAKRLIEPALDFARSIFGTQFENEVERQIKKPHNADNSHITQDSIGKKLG